MAFEGLSEKLNSVFKKLRSRGRLTEGDVKEALREVRLALLEADVNFKVVKDFCAQVSERAVGAGVFESLSPAQTIVKIVHEELTALMGTMAQPLKLGNRPPAVILICGLQGAGKTTHAANLGGLLKKQGHRPLLAACDVYRPAAVDQLKVTAGRHGLPVYDEGQGDPVKIAVNAVGHARKHGNDVLLIDTAGRLHIDETLMDELRRIISATSPSEILLTVDAMTGQDAVTTAAAFHQSLSLTGLILTKLDGDARGGAALSVRAVTGLPIRYAGVGEKTGSIELFHPERMASRILGMGDVLTLIEKAEQTLDEKKAAELEKKLRQASFTLTDFLEQMAQLKGMGSVQDVLGMLPGIDKKALAGASVDENAMKRTEAIILSMTPSERDNPAVLNHSRKRRIAAGSGTRVEELNRLLKQFEAMKLMMKQMTGKLPGGKMPKGTRGRGGLFPGMM